MVFFFRWPSLPILGVYHINSQIVRCYQCQRFLRSPNHSMFEVLGASGERASAIWQCNTLEEELEDFRSNLDV